MKLNYLLCVIVVVLCGACAEMRTNMNVKNQTDRLRTTLTTYGADLRWGRYNHAYAYHVRRDGTQSPVNLDRLENFSITSFTPMDPVLNTEATEAVIPVEIKYYDEQYGTLRTFKETQKWWFNTEANSWFIDSEFPLLK